MPVGLNLHGSRFVASADAESESRAALSPEVATFAAEYCERFAAAWRVAGAPERRPHPRHSRDAGYVVGLAEGVAEEMAEWREVWLPSALLARDAAHCLPPPRRATAAPKRAQLRDVRRQGRAQGQKGVEGRQQGEHAKGKGKAAPAKAKANRENDEPSPSPAPAVFVPSTAPAAAAWGAAATDKAAVPHVGFSDLMAQEAAQQGGGAEDGGEAGAAQPTQGAQPTARGVPRHEAREQQDGQSPGGGNAWGVVLKGGRVARLKEPPVGGGGGSGGRAATAAQSQPQTAPRKPAVPLVVDLKAEARKSPLDRYGKLKCLTCGRLFPGYAPLEQHLKDKHNGVNSEFAYLLAGKGKAANEAGGAAKNKHALSLGDVIGDTIVANAAFPALGSGGGGSAVAGGTWAVAATKGAARGKKGGSKAAAQSKAAALLKPAKAKRAKPQTVTLSLAAYAREGAGAGKRAAGKAGGTKRRQQVMINPNAAESSDVVVRRRKEKEGGKRKRVSKLKKIILACRALKAAETLKTVEGTGGSPEGNGAQQEGGDGTAGAEGGGALTEAAVVETEVTAGGETAEGGADEGANYSESGGRVGGEVAATKAAQAASADRTAEDAEQAAASGGDDAAAKSVASAAGLPAAPAAPADADVASLDSSTDWDCSDGGMVDPDATPVPSEVDESDAAVSADVVDPADAAAPADKVAPADAAAQADTAAATDPVAEATASSSSSSAAPSAPAAAGPPATSAPTTYVGEGVKVGYVRQVITTELNKEVVALLKELLRFQARALAKDPAKAKAKKRLVSGLREVTKSVSLGRAKAVVVAPNVEQVGGDAGLDSMVQNIIATARDKGTPVVFALTRNKLGSAMGRRCRMSTVAILDYSGAEELFKGVTKAAKALAKEAE